MSCVWQRCEAFWKALCLLFVSSFSLLSSVLCCLFFVSKSLCIILHARLLRMLVWRAFTCGFKSEFCVCRCWPSASLRNSVVYAILECKWACCEGRAMARRDCVGACRSEVCVFDKPALAQTRACLSDKPCEIVAGHAWALDLQMHQHPVSCALVASCALLLVSVLVYIPAFLLGVLW